MSDIKLTDKEQDVLNKSVELWNAIVALPVINPNQHEINEYRVNIHDIQARVMSRPYRRSLEPFTVTLTEKPKIICLQCYKSVYEVESHGLCRDCCNKPDKD